MFIKIAILFLATIAAFWISAICGGGASLVLVPLLNLLLPTTTVPFALTIGTFTSSASRIVVFKKHIRWNIFLWFVPFSIPAVVLGGWAMKLVNPLYLQFFVALFLLANIPELFRSKKKQQKEQKPYPKLILALVGFAAGFISGITGAIGLLFNRFYLRYGLSKEEIIATRAANEIFLHALKLTIYLLLGLYSGNALWLGITIAVASILSSYTVKYILPFLSEFLFRKIGYGAMAISGIFLLSSTTKDIMRQDNIAFSRNKYDETTMNWRNSSFVLEFSFDEGMEIERQINPGELPSSLQLKFRELQAQFDQVFLERVYRLGAGRAYEFYCYKNDKLTKMEFKV